MKPWEENWVADAAGVMVITESGGFLALDSHFDGDGPGRATLAAQAPVMARILLSELRNDPIGFKEGLDQIRTVLRDAGVLS